MEKWELFEESLKKERGRHCGFVKYDVNSYQFLFHYGSTGSTRGRFFFFFFYYSDNLEALISGNASREREIDGMEGWGETQETRVASLEPARGGSDDDWLW